MIEQIVRQTFTLPKDWCNWVKLLAAILVAVSHYSTVVVINNHWSDSNFLRFWCQGGYIGVALFFYFSGYGLMESEAKNHLSVLDFFKKRFLKVYLPVLLVSAIWIPIYYIYVGNDKVDFNVLSVLYDIFWGFRDCVLWFVKILFLLYGLFCLFAYLLHRKRTAMAHCAMALGTIGTTWVAYQNDFPFISVPLFLLGVWGSNVKSLNFKGVPLPLLLIMVMVMICGLCFLFNRSADVLHGVVNCMVLTITLYGCITFRRFTPPLLLLRLSEYLISVTYTIYIVHFKVLDFMTSQWGYIPFGSWVLATFVVTVIVTYIRRLLKI